MGRSISATLVGFLDDGFELAGISRLIAMEGLSVLVESCLGTTTPSATPMARRSRYQRSTGCSFGVAVAAEQLHAVQADAHALVAAQLPGQRRLAGERQTLVCAGGAAPGDHPQTVEFDGDVGAHERHRLPAGDRLAERFAFLDVGDDVVEDGVTGATARGGPAEPGQRDGLRVVPVVGRLVGVFAQPGRQRHRDLVELHLADGGGAQAHAPVGAPSARGVGLDEEHRRLAVELRCDDEQFGLGGRGNQ